MLRGVLLVVIPTIPQAETDADLDSAKQLIRLLYEGTQPLLLSAVYLNYDIDGPNSSIGEKWLSYHYTLTDFLGSVVQHANVSAPGDSWEEFLKDTMHWILPQWLSLAKLCNYSELTNKHILINSAKSPELQHFVESMATLLSIYLQKEYPSMIESVIASAINASAFREIAVSITEKTHSWTEEYQERFGEYR